MGEYTNAYIGTDNATQWQSPPINTPEEIAKLQETGVLPPEEEATDEECVDETDDETTDEVDETDENGDRRTGDATLVSKDNDLESPVPVEVVENRDAPPVTPPSEVVEDRRTVSVDDDDEKDKPVFRGGLL